MDKKPNVNLADLLCYLRQDLLDAREQKDEHKLARLSTTCDVLAECIEKMYLAYDNRQIYMVVDDFYCAARDSGSGAEWKSPIPSVEEIQEATS